MGLPIDRLIQDVEGEEMAATSPAPRATPPWWAWLVIMVGLGELGWFGTAFLRANQQSAATSTEIQDIQQHQQNLATSINTLDIDVQALSVNVAVLTQRMEDQEKAR